MLYVLISFSAVLKRKYHDKSSLREREDLCRLTDQGYNAIMVRDLRQQELEAADHTASKVGTRDKCKVVFIWLSPF